MTDHPLAWYNDRGVIDMIYLAHPIDQAGKEVQPLVGAAKEALSRAGLGPVYTPGGAWAASPEDAARDGRIHEVNEEAIRRAAGVLAILPPGVPTRGVYYELGYARALGKPAVVWGRFWPHIPASEDLEEAVVLLAGAVRAAPGIQYLRDGGGAADTPYRVRPGDAGYDVPTAEEAVVPPGGYAHIRLAHRLFAPDGYWVLLVGRSSATTRWGLLVIPSVMDWGYTGPWYARVLNISGHEVRVPAGTRLVQAVPLPLPPHWPPVEVEKAPERDRGENGFGSTGM